MREEHERQMAEIQARENSDKEFYKQLNQDASTISNSQNFNYQEIKQTKDFSNNQEVLNENDEEKDKLKKAFKFII